MTKAQIVKKKIKKLWPGQTHRHIPHKSNCNTVPRCTGDGLSITEGDENWPRYLTALDCCICSCQRLTKRVCYGTNWCQYRFHSLKTRWKLLRTDSKAILAECLTSKWLTTIPLQGVQSLVNDGQALVVAMEKASECKNICGLADASVSRVSKNRNTPISGSRGVGSIANLQFT